MASQEITTVLTEFAEFLGQEDKKHKTAIGNLDDLTTEQKTSLVVAINELKQSITTLSGSSAGINDSATGDSSTLSAKKSLSYSIKQKQRLKAKS